MFLLYYFFLTENGLNAIIHFGVQILQRRISSNCIHCFLPSVGTHFYHKRAASSKKRTPALQRNWAKLEESVGGKGFRQQAMGCMPYQRRKPTRPHQGGVTVRKHPFSLRSWFLRGSETANPPLVEFWRPKAARHCWCHQQRFHFHLDLGWVQQLSAFSSSLKATFWFKSHIGLGFWFASPASLMTEASVNFSIKLGREGNGRRRDRALLT